MKIVFSLILLLLAAFPAWCVDVPLPSGSKEVKRQTLQIAGKPIDSYVYYCPQTPDKVTAYYDKVMSSREFKPIPEYTGQSGETKVLRFRHGDDVVALGIEAQDQGTKIIVGSFKQAEGEAEPDPRKMTWADYIKNMPQEDTPGADLDIVPRPPKSVRQQSRVIGRTAILSYSTPQTTQEMEKFYHGAMPGFGWTPAGDIDYDKSSQAVKAYGNKAADQLVQAPVGDMRTSDLLRGSKVMRFTSPKGMVKVSIVDANPGKEPAVTIVTIDYRENAEVYGKK